jgi:hypothetical protein
LDTSPEAYAIQTEARRQMSMEQRFDAMVEISELMREIALTGMRARHPGWSEVELMKELLRSQLAGQPIPPPLR